jgi:hypothetical protein
MAALELKQKNAQIWSGTTRNTALCKVVEQPYNAAVRYIGKNLPEHSYENKGGTTYMEQDRKFAVVQSGTITDTGCDVHKAEFRAEHR